MELKLEDYARRIDRFYYEIMREYADGAPTTKDLEIFIRPDSVSYTHLTLPTILLV